MAQEKMKWFTEVTNVDVETGEILKEYQLKKGDYYVTKTEKNTYVEEYTQNGYIKKRGAIRILRECRPTGQQELFT